MPIETSQFHFSRELLPPDTFNEDPPPVPAATEGGTASGAGLDRIKVQVREGREPGRTRAALGRSRSEMRLDDPLPWNEILSTIVDPGYATPRPKRVMSPAAFDSSRAESPGVDDGRRSAPPGFPGRHERPQSMGCRTVSSVYLPGAGVWRAGTLMSPAVAERLMGSRSNTPTLDRRVAQTAVFGDSAESAPEVSPGSRIRRTLIRVWQGIMYPPRKLVAVCQEWLRRYID